MLSDLLYRCCDSTEEEDGSCDSEDGAGDIKISSSSKEAPANPAGIVPLSSQSSKPQANRKAKSKRPESSGEIFIHRLDINLLQPHKNCYCVTLKDRDSYLLKLRITSCPWG